MDEQAHDPQAGFLGECCEGIQGLLLLHLSIIQRLLNRVNAKREKGGVIHTLTKKHSEQLHKPALLGAASGGVDGCHGMKPRSKGDHEAVVLGPRALDLALVLAQHRGAKLT